jgi:hypothetical protein
MAIRDFHQWMEDNKKKLEDLPPVSEAGSARRAGVRKHAYPAIYSRGQYPDADNITHAADANFYLHQRGE